MSVQEQRLGLIDSGSPFLTMYSQGDEDPQEGIIKHPTEVSGFGGIAITIGHVNFDLTIGPVRATTLFMLLMHEPSLTT